MACTGDEGAKKFNKNDYFPNMKNKYLTIALVAFGLIVNAQPALYKEQYRPQFHFSPASNWCNDPDGLL